MRLRLIRLVIATLGAKLTEWVDSAHGNSEIVVKPYGTPLREVPNNKTMMILEISRVVQDLTVEGDLIIVPETERHEMESVIESYVDLLAVLNQCTRIIHSPHPYIAIEPLDDEAQSWIRGKRIQVATTGIPLRMWHQFDYAQALPFLQDRLDGVTLMAEALGHTHPTGKLHELIRFFECAFAMAAGELCRTILPQFLADNGNGYTETEVEHWLELRDTSSHADRRAFALQSDTMPVVNRVEQAAYDVLFNKTQWHVPTCERRSVFKPFCGSAGNDTSIFITQGEPARLESSIVDGFHTYPLNLNACITTIPNHWLTATTADRPASRKQSMALSSGRVEVERAERDC